MSSRTATIASSVGLHAHASGPVHQEGRCDGCVPVTIGKEGGKAVNAASMLAVMSLGAKYGEDVVLSAEGNGTDGVLADFVAFLETDHDAEN